MEVKAELKFVRVGAQKARIVANRVRGCGINEALKVLSCEPKKSARLIQKLMESAVSNAEEKQVVDVDNLYIKELLVDEGPFLKRQQPRAQGRAFIIKKRLSHIRLVLGER